MTFKTSKSAKTNSPGESHLENFDEHLFTMDLVGQIDLSQKQSTIEVLKVGKIHDRNLEITQAMLDDYVANWKAGVYGTDLQVNLSHDREGVAAGWIKNLFRDGDILKATVEWTPLGEEQVSTKQFRYISSELAPSYPDHKTGEKVKNVFIGCALTNVPAVKGLAPVALSENLQLFLNNKTTMDQMKKDHDGLMKKDKLTKADLAEFTKKHGETEGHDGLKAKLEEKYAADHKEPDGDEEEEKEEGKGEPDGDEGKKKKLSEGGSHVSLAEFRKQQVELAEERKARIELQEKIERKELSELITERFVLSEDVQVGIKNDEETLDTFVNFSMGLTKDQRQTFLDEILPAIQHVDLSVRGEFGVSSQSKMKSNMDIDKNADAIVARAAVLLKEKKADSIEAAQKLAIREAKGEKIEA